MKEFMTYEMSLLESRMEGEQRGLLRGRTERDEAIAIKMLRKDKSFEEIHEFTDLPFERIKQLASKIFS